MNQSKIFRSSKYSHTKMVNYMQLFAILYDSNLLPCRCVYFVDDSNINRLFVSPALLGSDGFKRISY